MLLIAALELENAAVNLCMWGGKKELASALGLTFNQYLKGAQAGRVMRQFPEFIELVLAGKTHLSHLATLAPKITAANKEIFLEGIIGKSERNLRAFVASVNKDGSFDHTEIPRARLKLSLTDVHRDKLERARGLLSEGGMDFSYEDVLVLSLDCLLERLDPHSVPNVVPRNLPAHPYPTFGTAFVSPPDG